MTCGPTSPSTGVQVKVLLTGLPAVGSPGVIVAPLGRPATLSVTDWTGTSGSDAETPNEISCPVVTGSVDPHTGAIKTGGTPVFATSWMKKSTAIVPMTVPTPFFSSMVTCVE